MPPCLPRWLDSRGMQRSKAGSKTSAVMSPETVLLGIAILLSNYGGCHRILAELHQRRRYRKIVKKPRHNDDAPKRPTGGTVRQICLRPRISNPLMPIEHLIPLGFLILIWFAYMGDSHAPEMYGNGRKLPEDNEQQTKEV